MSKHRTTEGCIFCTTLPAGPKPHLACFCMEQMASKAKLHQKQAPSMAKAWKIPPTGQIPGVTGSVELSQTCHHHLQLLFSSLIHIPTIIVLLPSVIPDIPWQGRTSALSSALSECTHGFTSLSAVRVTSDMFSSVPCLLTHYKPSSLLIISLPWAAASTVC